ATVDRTTIVVIDIERHLDYSFEAGLISLVFASKNKMAEAAFGSFGSLRAAGVVFSLLSCTVVVPSGLGSLALSATSFVPASVGVTADVLLWNVKPDSLP